METLEKKGKGSALLPFLLFIVIYLGAGLYFQAQGVEMAFYPVSYTHLDVYKRQLSARFSEWAWP